MNAGTQKVECVGMVQCKLTESEVWGCGAVQAHIKLSVWVWCSASTHKVKCVGMVQCKHTDSG